MPRFDVAALTDIPEGTPHEATAGETPVLLLRRGQEVTAFANACPHFGFPLSGGAVVGDTLICPFHHACFNARTGQQTQPPGHGDLRRYAVAVSGGRVHVTVDEDAPHVTPSHSRQALDTRRVVIAGSGAAGAACATTLREEGYEGVIEMIAPGAARPLDRTALSKEVLTGEMAPDDLTLLSQEDLAQRDIALIDGRVTGVEAGRVHLADGGLHAFDALVLAPGGQARRPDLPGAALPNVHTLRDGAEATALVASCEDARRAVLVGGGFIGMEAALSLSKRGLSVTLVLQEELPLSHILGERVARVIMAEHGAAGVTFVTDASVQEVTGDDRATGLRLADGRHLPADVVVLAMGVTPATAEIAGLPLDDDGGVATDAQLAVPGLEAVYVAGDCAAVPTPFGRARIEHWRTAQQHGRRAARALLGLAPEGGDIPFFWTALARQYRYVGHADGWDDLRFDGDPEGAFLAHYLRDGMVVAAATAGRDADLARLHLQMVEAGGPIPADALGG